MTKEKNTASNVDILKKWFHDAPSEYRMDARKLPDFPVAKDGSFTKNDIIDAYNTYEKKHNGTMYNHHKPKALEALIAKIFPNRIEDFKDFQEKANTEYKSRELERSRAEGAVRATPTTEAVPEAAPAAAQPATPTTEAVPEAAPAAAQPATPTTEAVPEAAPAVAHPANPATGATPAKAPTIIAVPTSSTSSKGTTSPMQYANDPEILEFFDKLRKGIAIDPKFARQDFLDKLSAYSKSSGITSTDRHDHHGNKLLTYHNAEGEEICKISCNKDGKFTNISVEENQSCQIVLPYKNGTGFDVIEYKNGKPTSIQSVGHGESQLDPELRNNINNQIKSITDSSKNHSAADATEPSVHTTPPTAQPSVNKTPEPTADAPQTQEQGTEPLKALLAAANSMPSRSLNQKYEIDRSRITRPSESSALRMGHATSTRGGGGIGGR